MNSLRKGKRFEREVAKKLTEALGINFRRVPMSGAFATHNNTKNPVFKGDIFTEDKNFGVVIECKRIAKLTPSVLKKWLDQCKREAKPNNFWLIYREDYKDAMIIRGYYNRKKLIYYVLRAEPLTHWLSHYNTKREVKKKWSSKDTLSKKMGK